MSLFQSVSSEVTSISSTRNRQAMIACLDNVLSLVRPHSELASVSTEVERLKESVQPNVRSLKRGAVIRRLEKRVLPQIESFSASVSSAYPQNVVKVFERVIINAHMARGKSTVIDPESLYAQADSEGAYLNSMEDLKLFRQLIYAPQNHAKLGLDLLSSIADMKDTKVKAAILAKLKPVMFADEAVVLIYNQLLNNVSYNYKQILSQKAIRIDDYAEKYFPRSLNKTMTEKRYGSSPYDSVAKIKQAAMRLIESRKHLNDLAAVSPVVDKKYKSVYTDRSHYFLESMGDALRSVLQLAREASITKNQQGLRQMLKNTFDKKLPTKFSEASSFTMRSLPIEAYIKGSPAYHSPEKLANFGMDLQVEQVGRKKSDVSYFYMDQPVLFFHRDILTTAMLEELNETANAQLENQSNEVKRIRKNIRDNTKRIGDLQTKRVSATTKAAMRIDKEIDELTKTNESLTAHEETVKTSRAKQKKDLDARIKKFASNRNELMDMALRLVIENINERSSSEFTLVSSTYRSNPKSPVSSIAWLMPKAQYEAMESALGNMSVVSWNLPWASKPKARKA